MYYWLLSVPLWERCAGIQNNIVKRESAINIIYLRKLGITTVETFGRGDIISAVLITLVAKPAAISRHPIGIRTYFPLNVWLFSFFDLPCIIRHVDFHKSPLKFSIWTTVWSVDWDPDRCQDVDLKQNKRKSFFAYFFSSARTSSIRRGLFFANILTASLNTYVFKGPIVPTYITLYYITIIFLITIVVMTYFYNIKRDVL